MQGKFRFAGLLVLAAILGLTGAAWAAPGDTADDPVIITSAAELAAIEKISADDPDRLGTLRKNLAKHYKLGADIDLNNETWTPIGKGSTPFMGTFDGSGKLISGLLITDARDDTGLFGHVGAGGVVKNLGVSGSVTGGYNVGGVAGSNSGTVSNCYFTGSVTGKNYHSGGVVGYNGGTVSNCYNIGDISGKDYVGGVAGYNTKGTVEYCYNIGSVSGKVLIGGVLGWNGAGGKMQHCLSLGLKVTAEGGSAGRVAGDSDEDNATLLSNKARADMKVYKNTTELLIPVSAPDGIHGEDVPLGAPLAEVFAGWSDDIWNIPGGSLTAGASLPTLKAVPQVPEPKLP